MGHLYNSKLVIKKKTKINFFSPDVWRRLQLIGSNPVHHTSEKKIRSRGSVIPLEFDKHEIVIHSGKKWHTRYVNEYMIGFKFGEFTWNRRYALFKAKQLRKKKTKGKK